jgi:Family of unknown function (DUF6174)
MKKSFLKSIALGVFLTNVFLILSCAQQAKVESKPSNLSPTPANKPANIARENYIKDWKNKYDATIAEIERNRSLWQKSAIANYDFEANKYFYGVTSPWGASPALIKVRNNQNISIEPVSKDSERNISSYKEFDTIDKFFDFIRETFEKGTHVDVKYDKKYGYPKNIFIDFDYAVIDDERGISINKFKVAQ